MKYWMLLFALLWVSYGTGMARKTEKVVNNGIPWFDDRGEIVNAHGACIVEENGRYYLFGEYKSDKSNAFPGFSCYSSDDLVNWRFGIRLPIFPPEAPTVRQGRSASQTLLELPALLDLLFASSSTGRAHSRSHHQPLAV